MRKTAVILTTCLLLAGCAAGKQLGSPAADPTPYPLAAAVPMAESGPGARLLLVEYNMQAGTIRPVDELSLADVPDHRRISIRHHFTHAFSPDGKTLATITWPGGEGTGGELHLIDVDAWQDQVTEVRVDWHIGELLFSPDGTALYWLQPVSIDPAHGLPREYALIRYRLSGGGGAQPVVQFPATLMPHAYRLVGERLAVYGTPTDAENRPEDAPHVMLVDIAKAQIAADIRLDGVVDGNQRATDGTYLGYNPGLAWDIPHSKLYVAEAASDRITVVDLAAGKVLKQEAVRPRTSLGDRLLSWLQPTAEAKMMAGVFRQALLSPDGTRLYRFGQRYDQPPADTVLPVDAVAVADMAQVGRLDLGASDVAISPDGRYLLAAGDRTEVVRRDGNAIETRQRGAGLSLVDVAQMKRLAHIEPEALFQVNGFSSDSRQAYVLQMAEPGRQGPVVLQRFDMDAQRVAASRRLTEGNGYLIGLAADR